MPTEPGSGKTKRLPSTAWTDFRNFLQGHDPNATSLPSQLEQLAKHGRGLPNVVASDLWRRRTK